MQMPFTLPLGLSFWRRNRQLFLTRSGSSALVCVGWGPYAYFRVLEESRSGAQATSMVNLHNVQATDSEVGNQEDANSSDGFMGLHLANHPSALTLEELEAGRR